MFVEVVEYPAKDIDLALLVTASGGSVYAGIYSRGEGELDEAVPATEALSMMSSGNAPFVISHKGSIYMRQSVAVHSQEGMLGFDELVDYSVLDLYKDGNVWEPRLPDTKNVKLIYSARVRDFQRRRLLASLYIRFATGDLSETVVHLVDRGGCLVTDLVADSKFDGTAFPVGPGGALWLNHFWHAEVIPVQRGDDGRLMFDVVLKNNRDGSDCARPTRLELSADAGYLPRRFVTTDEMGKARFSLIPLGLQAGERVKVKVSATHFTNLGSASVEV